MEMEDHNHHHHHHHHQQQQHQYGITADLRQLMSSIGSSNNRTATHFTAIPQPRDLFSGHHRDLSRQGHGRHYDMLMVGHRHHHDLTPRGELHEFRSDSASTAAAAVTNGAIGPASSVSMSGLEGEKGSFGGDAGTGRWPRQETLTLLEIRSRLDPKFKEANQKGPLWDEVSRIMSKEHGYQRSGKKCREKFENLYKYYKKTKEGKAGRQDGKHYRFFRQLEALYGETSNAASVPETPYLANTLQFHTTSNTSNRPNQEACHSQKLCDSLSLSNSSDFDISSSDGNDLSTKENDSKDRRRKRGGGRSWKAKIKEFIDSQMRKLMEKQEAWLVKLTKTLEQKEQERNLREEEWRKQEAVRIDREHKFWAKERAWIEARDAAFMDALQNITGKQLKALCREEFMGAEIQNYSEHQKENGSETMETVKADSWEESEITRLVDLRNSMESSFQENGCANEVLWEKIAAKMGCLGYDRSAIMYKDKWNSISGYVRKSMENKKKRKENSRICSYYPSNDSIYHQGGTYSEINEQGPESTVRVQANDGSSPSNSNVGNAVNDSCFRFFMTDNGENLWENYGMKICKGENQ